MKKVAFTAVDDVHFYPEGTHIMINSFKRFHPDIPLVVFRQNTVDELFKEKNINWYQAKPYFAELLMNDYDLVVNMDADHIVLDRMTEVFDNIDYDVAFPWNKNEYEDAEFENITAEMYLQAGLVASTSKEFWLKWQDINRTAMDYVRKENDTVNLLVYNEMPGLNLKILDKHKDFYGCKSLGREMMMRAVDDKTYIGKDQVVAYHYARGGQFPKLDIERMDLMPEVKKLWTQIATEGQTVKIL